MPADEPNRERARTATGEELASLLHHQAPDVLLALLDNPAVGEAQLCLLLDRKDLPAEVLEEVARRKPLLKNYGVKRVLAFHPRKQCRETQFAALTREVGRCLTTQLVPLLIRMMHRVAMLPLA